MSVSELKELERTNPRALQFWVSITTKSGHATTTDANEKADEKVAWSEEFLPSYNGAIDATKSTPKIGTELKSAFGIGMTIALPDFKAIADRFGFPFEFTLADLEKVSVPRRKPMKRTGSVVSQFRKSGEFTAVAPSPTLQLSPLRQSQFKKAPASSTRKPDVPVSSNDSKGGAEAVSTQAVPAAFEFITPGSYAGN